MVGQREFMDVHDGWMQGKSSSEIARQSGRDRKTIRRLLREGAQAGRKPRQISSKLDPFRQYLLGRRGRPCNGAYPSTFAYRPRATEAAV